MNTDQISNYSPLKDSKDNGDYLSVGQIKRHNSSIGQHFFSSDTLAFFSGEVYDYLHLGHYFITSEKDTYTKQRRRYSICQANNDGTIDTVGTFQQYPSLDSAYRAMSKITERPTK